MKFEGKFWDDVNTCAENFCQNYTMYLNSHDLFCLLLLYNHEKNLRLIDHISLLAVKLDAEKVFNYTKSSFWWSGKLFDRRKKNIYGDFLESFFFVL